MKKKVVKSLFFIVFAIYAIITLINQQITLNKYNENQSQLAQQIEEETNYNQELLATQENVNSTEYIEEVAREKLDMYLPTERVYIDTGM